MHEKSKKIRFFIWFCILGFATLATSGCGTYYTHAYKTDIANGSELKVIAFAPVELPLELPQGEKAKVFFHAAISEKLSSAGFQVVGPDVFADKMAALARKKGGAYDPVTGKRDEKKFQELQKACMKDVQATTGAKVLLRAKVEPVSAPFGGCRGARWDGVTQDVSWVFLGIFCGTSNMHGRVPALSLLVSLEDFDGNLLYFNGGGIELTSRVVTTFLGGGFERVPLGQLLVDEMRNRNAVNVSLDPLVLATSKQR